MSTTIGEGRAKVPDWRNLVLDEGILSEPVREDNRVVLWLPADRDREYQYWERIGTAAPRGDQGRTGESARRPQPRRGPGSGSAGALLGKLTRKLTGAGGKESWILPNGQPAERCGERKTDLVLAWPEDDSAALDEAAVRSRWPA